MGPLHKRRWKGALRRRPIIMVRRRAGMVGVVMTLLCLTQLLSISEANVPEAAVSAPADIIPKEVHETLQASSDLLQDPEDFVEGLSASPNAAHRAAKANKQIMSADDAISALAKRTKKELKGDLSAKSVASLKPVHLHRSRAAKKAAKKIAARTVGEEAKREAKKHGGHKQKKALRMAILVGQRKKALRKAKAALMLATKRRKAKKAAKKAVKKAVKKAKAKKKLHHLSHSKKNLFHPMSTQHSKAQCRHSCSSSSAKEVRHTCKKQCDKADYNCVAQCALPIKKCLCKCSSNKLWTCSGHRCGCWKLQHTDNGRVAKAMMKAENKALAKGLGKAVAMKKAAAAAHTAKIAKHGKAAKKPAALAQTKEWLKTVF